MKMFVINAKRAHGKKKTDGSPYEIPVVTVGLPIQNVTSNTYNLEGYGLDVAEMPLDPACLSKFANLKLPCFLELTVEAALMFGEIKNLVVNVQAIPASSANPAASSPQVKTA